PRRGRQRLTVLRGLKLVSEANPRSPNKKALPFLHCVSRHSRGRTEVNAQRNSTSRPETSGFPAEPCPAEERTLRRVESAHQKNPQLRSKTHLIFESTSHKARPHPLNRCSVPKKANVETA